MKKYVLPYGQGSKEIELDETLVLKEVRTKEFEPMKNIPYEILEAIYHPIGCPPINEIIKPGQKIAFICNDPTRVANSFDFMPVLVNEMNKLGVKDEDMHIVFALGTHRPMTDEEMVKAVGKDVASRLKMYNSLCNEQEDFKYFGTTSRGTPVWINKHLCDVDHVILTGTIVHHYFSGYGGGRKAILPGCAAMETVRVNHSFMLDPAAGLGKTTGNPCYEDQMEGVALFAKGRSLFLFNAILNAKHQFLKMFAGDYIKAHKEACKFVDEVYGSVIPKEADLVIASCGGYPKKHQFLKMFAGDYIKAHKEACKFVDEVYGSVIPKEADLVIASCGGYPKDINVYQMQKTMDNAACAVRKGGAVIMVAECVEGSGSAVLEEACRRLGSPQAIKAELEKDFRIGANKAYAVTRLMEKAKYYLVTALDRKMARDMLFSGAYDTIEEALAAAEKEIGKVESVIVMPEGSLTVPRVE